MRSFLACLLLAAGLSASAASAATVTTFLDLRSGGPITPRELVGKTSGDLRAVFSGWSRADGLARHLVSRTNQGMGVATLGGTVDQVDGAAGPEFLRVLFSQAVSLIDVTFGNAKTGDKFRVASGEAMQAYGSFSRDMEIDCLACDRTGIGSFAFLTPLTGSAFSFMAPGADDAWSVRGMTVAYDHQPAPIPLPAAGFLLVGGMAALGFAARRRRNARA